MWILHFIKSENDLSREGIVLLDQDVKPSQQDIDDFTPPGFKLYRDPAQVLSFWTSNGDGVTSGRTSERWWSNFNPSNPKATELPS